MIRKIKINEKVAEKIEKGAPWVFKGELQSIPSYDDGEVVYAVHNKRIVATCFFNSKSNITLRIIAKGKHKIDTPYLRQKIEEAYRIRKKYFMGKYKSMRVVFAEADLLPGLIVDKYEDVLVVQILSYGFERLREKVFSILDDIFKPIAIVERSDSIIREKEGLKIRKAIIKGKIPENFCITINDIKFKMDPYDAQKTGFFLDQKENYLMLKGIVKNKLVLDVFTYTGGWGLSALKYGAKKVVFIDSSKKALSLLKENIKLNNFSEDKVEIIKADAVRRLADMERAGKKFDVIILDPPAFVKSKSKLSQALRGYKDINLRAMKMVKKGGFLITCSCSFQLSRELFIKTLRDASLDAKKTARILKLTHQSSDHPFNITHPESFYLKCALIEIR